MTTPRKLNPPTMSLEGKVALFTGGSRGIGAATVRMFVQAGARVVFNYARANAEAEKLVAECGSDLCHAVQADLNGTSAGREAGTSGRRAVWRSRCVGGESRNLAGRTMSTSTSDDRRAVAKDHRHQPRQRFRTRQALRRADEAAGDAAATSSSSARPPGSEARPVTRTTRPPRARSSA